MGGGRFDPVGGDRRDFYVTEPDVWTMFFRIMQERKRREFDPALQAVRSLVVETGASGEVRERLEQMADLLGTMESVMGRFLTDPASSRAALGLFAGLNLRGLALPGLGRAGRKKR